MAATESQIHPLESWEKPQGMFTVILIKHVLLRGKAQPSFVKEGPDPALIPLHCQRLPGLTLMSWFPAGASHSGPPCPNGTHSLASSISLPSSNIPKESQTWTSQQIKWKATESQLKHSMTQNIILLDETPFPQPGFKEQYYI